MARPGWYNDNRNRAFPFIEGTAGKHLDSGATELLMNQLPDEIIVDTGFITGAASNFDSGSHSIYLQAIRRVSDTYYFDFESDAPQLYGVTLTFTRSVDDQDYLTEHVEESNSNSLSCSESDGCCHELLSGYLITANLERLGDFLSSGDTLTRTAGDAIVEPALIQNLAGTFLLTASLANANRTRATASESCDDYTWDFDEDFAHFISDVCVKGDLRFKEGYNCKITQNSVDNSITFAPVVGGGAGEPCEEVPLFASETVELGGSFLSGGPKCSETLRSINGVSGSLFSITGGPGVVITEDPINNKLTIDVDMSDLAICFGSDSSDISDPCGSV